MAELMEVIGTGCHESVDSLLDAFSEMATSSNAEAYFACFASPQARFLGTDAKENWTAEEFYVFAKPYFEKAKAEGKPAWQYDLIDGTRKIDVVENIAYFDELLVSVSFRATTRGNGVAI